MFSDNAKNFKCASKEIRLLYKSVNWAKVQAEGQKTKTLNGYLMLKKPHGQTKLLNEWSGV
jgi:hypothetical protein